MNFLSRLVNVVKRDSLVVTFSTQEFKQFLQHDDYDRYLFECAKKQIGPLREVLNQEMKESSGLDALLQDVFAMCYKAEPQWEENIEKNRYYDTLKRLMEDPGLPELRKKTRFNGLLSALATVAFAKEYQKREQEIDQQQSGRKDALSRKPKFLGIFKSPVIAGVGGSGEQSALALVEIERHVGLQNDKLMLWGITPTMVPLEPERVMKLADLLERHSEFLLFAEKVGQFRKSLVSLGKKKLRQKGVRLRGVSVGNNIIQAVPSELALLGDVNSEAVFYDRVLGSKLAIHDYAGKSKHKRGSMVIVIDGSGSVRGQKGYIIRGIAVALVQLARIEKRWASVIIFGSKNEQQEFIFDPHENTIADRLVEMATTFYGGDTIFWEPLELAFERLNTKAFRQGDLVLVTDYICGDEGPLSSYAERFAQAKAKFGFRYFSLFLPSDQWVNDLSWHTLADHVISLNTNFFEQGSSLTLDKFASIF